MSPVCYMRKLYPKDLNFSLSSFKPQHSQACEFSLSSTYNCFIYYYLLGATVYDPPISLNSSNTNIYLVILSCRTLNGKRLNESKCNCVNPNEFKFKSQIRDVANMLCFVNCNCFDSSIILHLVGYMNQIVPLL